MMVRSLSLAQEEAVWRSGRLGGGVMEAKGLRYGNSTKVPEDSKGGKLGLVGVDFWSPCCSSAPPSPLCTHGLGLHRHLRPGTGCWASSLGPGVQTAQTLGRQHG